MFASRSNAPSSVHDDHRSIEKCVSNFGKASSDIYDKRQDKLGTRVVNAWIMWSRFWELDGTQLYCVEDNPREEPGHRTWNDLGAYAPEVLDGRTNRDLTRAWSILTSWSSASSCKQCKSPFSRAIRIDYVFRHARRGRVNPRFWSWRKGVAVKLSKKPTSRMM